MVESKFEFEETIEVIALTEEQVKELIAKFNLKVEEPYRFGNLLIEKFSDDEQIDVEYDISLEICNNSFRSRTYRIKTDKNLDLIKIKFENMIKRLSVKA